MVNIMYDRAELNTRINDITLKAIECITEDKNDPNTSIDVDKWGAQQHINKYGTKISKLLCEEVSNEKSIQFNSELVRILKGCRKMSYDNLIKKVKELWQIACFMI